MDTLESEFNHYQIDPDIDYDKDKRIDEQWHTISEMEDVSGVGKRYQFLPAVMQCEMAIYHSNADCKRVFSMVNKNKTKEHGNISTSTLNSLMTHKLEMQNRGIICHSASYSKTLLRAEKSSTYKGLNQAKPSSSAL